MRQVVFQRFQVVSVVDHHATGASQTVVRTVPHEIDSLDEGAVAQVEAGHRIEGATAFVGAGEVLQAFAVHEPLQRR